MLFNCLYVEVVIKKHRDVDTASISCTLKLRSSKYDYFFIEFHNNDSRWIFFVGKLLVNGIIIFLAAARMRAWALAWAYLKLHPECTRVHCCQIMSKCRLLRAAADNLTCGLSMCFGARGKNLFFVCSCS